MPYGEINKLPYGEINKLPYGEINKNGLLRYARNDSGWFRRDKHGVKSEATVIARSERSGRHCEERSDEAIQNFDG